MDTLNIYYKKLLLFNLFFTFWTPTPNIHRYPYRQGVSKKLYFLENNFYSKLEHINGIQLETHIKISGKHHCLYSKLTFY